MIAVKKGKVPLSLELLSRNVFYASIEKKLEWLRKEILDKLCPPLELW